jgi:hypothetical protein
MSIGIYVGLDYVNHKIIFCIRDAHVDLYSVQRQFFILARSATGG